ncbi:replication protein [Escherichia coli]|nr:replication protein [Escherichia coli]
MKTPVTVLSDMLRAIRDADPHPRISEPKARVSSQHALPRGCPHV